MRIAILAQERDRAFPYYDRFAQEHTLHAFSSAGSYTRDEYSWEELSAALLLLQRGGGYYDATEGSAGARAASSTPQRSSGETGESVRLTDREKEVLNRLSEGWTNRGMADTLGISENTVKFHLNAIFRKLGAESRTEALVIAAGEGLLSL